ncbi:MAG: FGGY family carbohydrate kinase, partial [Bryobacterales bacterium]|nr:FGGY family carbohydrate kinase [Bryobacterales bacterium]
VPSVPAFPGNVAPVPRFLGIDIGTSFIKTGLLDLDGLRVAGIARMAFPEPLRGLPPLYREYDPIEIVEVARRLIARTPRVGGIVFCGQMHGLVLADRQGQPLSNYIAWSDQRAADCFDQVASLVGPQARLELGNELRPSLPVSFLYWMARNGGLPEGAIPCSLADFVVANLCRAAPVVEPTQAAAMGALNLATGDWHWPAIERLGLSRLAWPALQPAGGVAGEFDGVPCYAAAGDHQCALAGVLLGEDELSINISTGSQVAAIAPRFEPAAHQTRPYFDGRFLRTVTHIPAGRALNALIALLTELGGCADPWAYLEAAAAQAGPTDLRADIAFFAGACGQRGSLENLHEGNLAAGHVFRAALESMARNYQDCAARIAGPEPWRRIVFSGGLALRSPLLRRLILERFDIGHRLAPSSEDTLCGLLILALVASGRCPDVRAATRSISPTHRGT